MSILDRDMLMRQLRFLQQLLQRVLKLESQRDLPEALEAVRNGYRQVLGIPYEMLARVDIDSARLLLATSERRAAYVELLRTEARLLRSQDEQSAAQKLEQRANDIDK